MESWLLQDPGTSDAHDELIVTEGAAKAMRAFSYEARFVSESLAFSNVYVAPRWVVDFCARAVDCVWHPPAFPSGPLIQKEQLVVEHAAKFILRGLKEPSFAAALFVILRENGLAACAALMDVGV